MENAVRAEKFFRHAPNPRPKKTLLPILDYAAVFHAAEFFTQKSAA